MKDEGCLMTSDREKKNQVSGVSKRVHDTPYAFTHKQTQKQMKRRGQSTKKKSCYMKSDVSDNNFIGVIIKTGYVKPHAPH